MIDRLPMALRAAAIAPLVLGIALLAAPAGRAQEAIPEPASLATWARAQVGRTALGL